MTHCDNCEDPQLCMERGGCYGGQLSAQKKALHAIDKSSIFSKIVKETKEALKEVDLIEAGKIKPQTLDGLLNEVFD